MAKIALPARMFGVWAVDSDAYNSGGRVSTVVAVLFPRPFEFTGDVFLREGDSLPVRGRLLLKTAPMAAALLLAR